MRRLPLCLVVLLAAGCGGPPSPPGPPATHPTPVYVPRTAPATGPVVTRAETRPVVPTKAEPKPPAPVDYTKTPGTAPLVAKPARPRQNLAELRAWLAIHAANKLDGLDNYLANENLAAMPELPFLRTWCRAKFQTRELNEAAVDELRDWLCLTFGFRQKDAENLTLEEIQARIRLAGQ